VSRPKLLTVLLACLVLPLTLSACGGDDDGGNDEEEITEAIETVAVSTDPADCTELQTQNFLDQNEIADGEEAIAECEEGAEDASGNPESIAVADVAVDGDSATASATPTGSPLDGQTLEVALVKDDDQWKLDEFTDIPNFDSQAYIENLAAQIDASGQLQNEQGFCFGQQLALSSEEDLKAMALGDSEILLDLFATCGIEI
jgi:hypothetical protein